MSTESSNDFSVSDKDKMLSPVEWRSGHVCLIDQRLLPHEFKLNRYEDVEQLSVAITDMVVRGAPAIGITAAYGVVLAARTAYAESPEHWQSIVEDKLIVLAESRPTAVNLKWAIERMKGLFVSIDGDPEPVLLREAQAIHEEDVAANLTMGKLGAELINDQSKVLTHCNAGALATGAYGTALGVIRTAFAEDKLTAVYACETRPWLQGARLTVWELMQDEIPSTLIADSAAAHLFQQGEIQWVIVGADRIAANGDVCNKIGTYSHAVNARHHKMKFMVVAPTSTIDLQTSSGSDIPIEQRASEEISTFSGEKITPDRQAVWNPAFDVTPAELVDFIVTEKGVIQAPNQDKIRDLMATS